MPVVRHILFVLPTLHAGGAENYTLRFIKYCQGLFQFSVISVLESKGDLHDQYVDAGVAVYYQSLGYSNPLKWLKFYRFLRSNTFDVICTMNGNFGGIPIFLARIAGIKKRIAFYRRSTNAFTPTKIKLAYNDWANRLVRKHATDILSNSRLAFDNFFEQFHLTDERFRIVPNGVSPDVVFAPESREFYREKFRIPGDAFVVGHVGRYDPAKNHETIFKVAARLLSVDPRTVFVFCGKDTDGQRFLHRLDHYGIKHGCICLGLQERVGEVLKTLDVFLFPSITEGQPNSLIEAMIAGIPIIASNIVSIQQTVPDFFASELVDPYDVEAIVEKIERRNLDSDAVMRIQKYAVAHFDQKTRFAQFSAAISNKS